MESTSFRKLRDGLAIAAIVVMTGILIRTAVGASGDRNQACVSNVKQVSLGLLMYVQDYDEHFPINMNDGAFVRQVLNPYIRNLAVFNCPATRNTPYIYNADLSGLAQPVIDFPAKTETMKDAKPHPDGKLTVGFADGHVERGGVPVGPTDPEKACIGNAYSLNTALLMYAQDYDATFPVFQNGDDVKFALTPYLGGATLADQRAHCPATGLLYNFNLNLSGKPTADFPDTANTVSLKDAKPHAKDGKITVAYLNGNIVRVAP